LRLCPGNAEPARLESANGDIALSQVCRSAEFFPIPGHKGAGDGDGAVVLNEGMEAHEASESTEEVVRNGGAGEIVDEPSKQGVLFHPGEEANHVVVSEMMGEDGADDEVDGPGRGVSEYIGGDPLDAAGGRSSVGGDGDGMGIDVEPG